MIDDGWQVDWFGDRNGTVFLRSSTSTSIWLNFRAIRSNQFLRCCVCRWSRSQGTNDNNNARPSPFLLRCAMRDPRQLFLSGSSDFFDAIIIVQNLSPTPNAKHSMAPNDRTHTYRSLPFLSIDIDIAFSARKASVQLCTPATLNSSTRINWTNRTARALHTICVEQFLLLRDRMEREACIQRFIWKTLTDKLQNLFFKFSINSAAGDKNSFSNRSKSPWNVCIHKSRACVSRGARVDSK